ncbi:MAG TPA: GNAT family N-acetyltransferase [Candidatus Dormibacteraeota bacterium]
MPEVWGTEHGVMWALDLPADPPAAAAPAGVRVAEVEASDAAALAAAMDVPGAEVAGRRGRGCRVFGAWCDGELASYCWVSTGRQHVGELARTLVLPEGDAYVWDCATLPPFRGRGIYTHLLRSIVRALSGDGVHRLWIGTGQANEASLRAFRSAGFQPAITMTALRLLGRGFVLRFGAAPGADPELVAAARRVLLGS